MKIEGTNGRTNERTNERSNGVVILGSLPLLSPQHAPLLAYSDTTIAPWVQHKQPIVTVYCTIILVKKGFQAPRFQVFQCPIPIRHDKTVRANWIPTVCPNSALSNKGVVTCHMTAVTLTRLQCSDVRGEEEEGGRSQESLGCAGGGRPSSMDGWMAWLDFIATGHTHVFVCLRHRTHSITQSLTQSLAKMSALH